jgi:hypothetical protein
MYAGSAMVAEGLLREAGFDSRKVAMDVLFNRVRVSVICL